MKHHIQNFFSGIPWLFVLTFYAIIGVGLFNLYSASGDDNNHFQFYNQIQWVGIGTLAFLFWGVILNLKITEKLSIIGYITLCFMLIIVLYFGTVVNGSQRWIALGSINLQPSEFAKFIIIIIVAKSFTLTKAHSEYTIFSLFSQYLWIGIPVLLIFKQPDLGTAGIVGLIAFIQLCFIKINWKSIAAFIFLGITGLYIAWNFIMLPYQKERVITFVDPLKDAKGDGYQLLQSIIAVGSGGLWGKGYRQGSQSQLEFLPERHTDFIFSVWAEEQGFIGAVTLLALYTFLILQILIIAERSKETFSLLTGVGVAAFFLLHLAINVSMILGWFPIVGAPLSLISYGGSHLLTAMSCAGLVVAIERHRVANEKNARTFF